MRHRVRSSGETVRHARAPHGLPPCLHMMTLPSGPSIVHATAPHTINVVLHVAFGTAALAAGLAAVVATKGGAQHRRFGRLFLTSLGVVIVTAAVGVFVFRFRAFLSVITLLAAYNGYSGWRALRLRTTTPERSDAAIALAALAVTAVFLAYLRTVHLPWAPVVIYSTLAALVLSAGYDLARHAFPARWRARLWVYEHLAKMLAAYSAIVSAFAGTVLSAWQPYSQILPSTFGGIAMIGFAIAVARRPVPGTPDPVAPPGNTPTAAPPGTTAHGHVEGETRFPRTSPPTIVRA